MVSLGFIYGLFSKGSCRVSYQDFLKVSLGFT